MNIITFNNHQLHKALFIKENLDLKINIFYQSKISKKAIKNTSEVIFIESLQEISVSNGSVDTFIFFSLYVSKEVWRFMSLLKKNSAKVILIEETHNMLMHPNKTPGINITPDHVIAASEPEQEAILDFYKFQSSSVSAPGWIFQKKYFDLMQRNENHKTNLNLAHDQTQSNILIYLGAPIDISVSSLEERYLRVELLTFIKKKYPNSKIFLKPHPLENLDFLTSFNSKNRFEAHICKQSDISQKDLKKFDLVISSAYSQCTMDCIIQELPLIIYAFREDNFITKSFNFLKVEPSNSQNSNYLRLCNVHENSSLPNLIQFKNLNLKDEHDALFSFKNLLINNFKPIDRSIELEFMGYLLGEHSALPTLLSDQCPSCLAPIKVLINDPQNFRITNLDFTSFTYPLRMLVSILILRSILNEKITSNTQIEYFFKEVFDPAYGLIFIKDSLVLRYFLIYKNMNFKMKKKHKIFLDKVESIFINKFFLGNIMSLIFSKILNSKFKVIKNFSYRSFLLCSNLIKS